MKVQRKSGFLFGKPLLEIGFPQHFNGFQKCTTNAVHITFSMFPAGNLNPPSLLEVFGATQPCPDCSQYANYFMNEYS